jgi:hypothetical protein
VALESEEETENILEVIGNKIAGLASELEGLSALFSCQTTDDERTFNSSQASGIGCILSKMSDDASGLAEELEKFRYSLK